jgi:hypothetical protein
MAADFFSVDPKHRRIDERLVNWSRWVQVRPASFTQPMFKSFRSSEVFGHNEISVPIDSLDAASMEKQVSALPVRHRDAIRWAYVYRIQPWRFCRNLGITQTMLADLIYEGRQMLVNRERHLTPYAMIAA